jgi:hypothetical protein
MNRTLFLVAALSAPLVAHATPNTNNTPGEETGPETDIPPAPKKPPQPQNSVTAPVLPPHPAQVPAFAISAKRPRLVVLLHGVTPKTSEDLGTSTPRGTRVRTGASSSSRG